MNHSKYRERLSKADRREYLRLKQREHRAKSKPRQQVSTNPETSTNCLLSTQAEAEAYAEAKSETEAEATQQACACGVEIPAEEDVIAYAKNWPGQPATGIPPQMNRAWVERWFAWSTSDRKVFPHDWKRDMQLRYCSDYRADKMPKKPYRGPNI